MPHANKLSFIELIVVLCTIGILFQILAWSASQGEKVAAVSIESTSEPALEQNDSWEILQ